MTPFEVLKRVLQRARNNDLQNPEHLAVLAKAVAAMEAGSSADEAFGLKRKPGNQPMTPVEREAVVDQVMEVLKVMHKDGINQEDAVAKVAQDSSKEYTLSKNVGVYRRIALRLLEEDPPPWPDDPSATEDFRGAPPVR